MVAHSPVAPGESHAGHVLRHSVMTLGTRIAVVLIRIPTSILIARLLGTEGQGTYTSAIVFPMLFAFVGLLGFDAAHTFLLSKRRYSLGQINGQTILVVVALSAIAVPAYLAFIRLYGGAVDPPLRSLLSLGAVLIPVFMARDLSAALLLGLHRIRWFNIANLVHAASLLIFVSVNLLLLGGGVRGTLVAFFLSEIAMILVALSVARKAGGRSRLIERPPLDLLKKSASYGLQGHVGNALLQLTHRYDMFLILSFAGVGAQGLYSVAVILAEKLLHIPESIRIVLFPKLSSLADGDAGGLTVRVTRNSLFVTTAAAGLLLLLSRPLLSIFYGQQYAPALLALRILIPGVAMLSLSTVLSGDLSARDKRIYQTIAGALGFGLNVLLCFFLIPRMGIEGAAWASTAAYTAQALAMLVFFVRLSGRGIVETVFLQREDMSFYAKLTKRMLTAALEVVRFRRMYPPREWDRHDR